MSAKVLFWDIETAPILAYVWGTFEQNVSLDQIHTDWHVLAWAAKWKDSKEVMYMDQRNAKDITNDKKILEGLWKLLDEADVVVTQNGIQFDAKKVNARFIEHGMKPPSPYKHVDTLRLAKKQFGFTSNKLAYMTNKLCEKYKKLDHGKFPGFSLWQECLKGNKKAWKEMETYNKHDVLALEELYGKLAPWGAGYDPNVYTETLDRVCVCGGRVFIKQGFELNLRGKYQKYRCSSCGSFTQDRINLLSKEKMKSLKQMKDQYEIEKRGYLIPDRVRVCSRCSEQKCILRGSLRRTRKGWTSRLNCNHCGYGETKVVKPLSLDEQKEYELKDRESLKRKKDCPRCGAKKSCIKGGVQTLKSGKRLRTWYCKSCFKYHCPAEA